MTMHPSHHHELHELEELQIKDGVYTCNLCKMPGHGKRYRCRSCDFDVHKFCLDPERKISPDAFPKYDSSSTSFFLLYHPPPPPQTTHQCRKCHHNGGGRRSCYVCGKAVEGLVYYRLETDCVMHPLCALLKREIREHVDGEGEDGGDVIFDLCDGHKGLKCDWCNEAKLKGSARTIPGMYYVSRVKDQGTFHVFCLMEMVNNTSTSSSAGSSSDHCHSNQLVKSRSISNRKGTVMKRTTNYGLGRTSTWVKMLKALLKIVLSVLFGDPTTLLSSLAVELFIK